MLKSGLTTPCTPCSCFCSLTCLLPIPAPCRIGTDGDRYCKTCGKDVRGNLSATAFSHRPFSFSSPPASSAASLLMLPPSFIGKGRLCEIFGKDVHDNLSAIASSFISSSFSSSFFTSPPFPPFDINTGGYCGILGKNVQGSISASSFLLSTSAWIRRCTAASSYNR